jgi:hypothetical protein
MKKYHKAADKYYDGLIKAYKQQVLEGKKPYELNYTVFHDKSDYYRDFMEQFYQYSMVKIKKKGLFDD